MERHTEGLSELVSGTTLPGGGLGRMPAGCPETEL